LTLSDLVEDTTYYWRVKANDGLVDSEWTHASFSVNTANEAPSAPTLSNPGNQSWVAGLLPTLQINAATDPDGDTLEYRFELFSESDLTTAQESLLTTQTQWELTTDLENHQWYYWHAQSEDPSGEVSDWSSFSSFFVDDNGVNDAPALSFIEPSEAIEVSEANVTLRWNDSDPDSNALIDLYYESTDVEQIAGAIEEDPEGRGDLYTWDASFVPNGTYQVYAIIDDGNTESRSDAPGLVTLINRDTVPDLVGLTQVVAELEIEETNFSLGEVSSEASDEVPMFQVISQSPVSSSAALQGTLIDLVISRGDQETLPLACDIEGDGDVDINDIQLISVARNQTALAGDPRDIDGDGTITIGDARKCVLRCTRELCVAE
jgi:hypothetical protein